MGLSRKKLFNVVEEHVVNQVGTIAGAQCKCHPNSCEFKLLHSTPGSDDKSAAFSNVAEFRVRQLSVQVCTEDNDLCSFERWFFVEDIANRVNGTWTCVVTVTAIIVQFEDERHSVFGSTQDEKKLTGRRELWQINHLHVHNMHISKKA